MSEQVMQSVRTTLIDVDAEHVSELPIRVVVSPLGVSINADGYGDHGTVKGQGSPLFLELHRGRLRLIVWSDINKEPPTHIINLDGAREDCRHPEG